MTAGLRLVLVLCSLFLYAPWVKGQSASLTLDFQGDFAVQEDAAGQKASLRRDGQPFKPAAKRGASAAPTLGVPEIQFEGGIRAQREARVLVDDASQAGNRVLELSVREPNVRLPGKEGMKSRVQMNLYQNNGVAELYQSVRLRLGPEMAAIASYPKAFNWFTLSEWWNNAGWTGEPYPFRISVNLGSAGPGQPLHLSAHATLMPDDRKTWSQTVWAREAADFVVPLGRWMLLEYFFREGDAKTGRFVMRITPEGGSPAVLFDVTDFTHHPSNPAPDGLRHLNPLKLYTSAALTEHVHRRGGQLVTLWDDLYVLACEMPAAGTAVSVCAQRMRLN